MEPIAISIEKQTPPTQARSPTQKEPALEVKENVKAEKEPDSSCLTELLDDVQKELNKIPNVDLHFSLHNASGKIMVTVTDHSTGEILRELPSSKILDMAARVEIMLGLIFDQKG